MVRQADGRRLAVNQRFDVLGFGLALISVALFVVSGFADPLFKSTLSASDVAAWVQAIGSIGALIGVFFAVTIPIRSERADRALEERRRSANAHHIGAIAISRCSHVASLMHGYATALLHEPRTQVPIQLCIDQLNGYGPQLRNAVAHWAIRQPVANLSVDEQLYYLMAILTIDTLLSTMEFPLDPDVAGGDIRRMVYILEKVRGYVGAFEAHIGEIFDRDSQGVRDSIVPRSRLAESESERTPK